jgi:hypothetical protein
VHLFDRAEVFDAAGFVGQLPDALGANRARRNRVDADSLLRPLDRQVLRDAGRDELGGAVGRLPLCPAMPEIEERQTIDPPPVASIASIAYLQVRNIPRPSMAKTRSQSSADDSSTSPSGMMPALATSTSSRP